MAIGLAACGSPSAPSSQASGPSNVAGSYWLAFELSPTCRSQTQLPLSTQSEFALPVAQQGANVTSHHLELGSLGQQYRGDMDGSVSGQQLSFSLRYWETFKFGSWSMQGDGIVSVRGKAMDGTFDGTYSSCGASFPPLPTKCDSCQAHDHIIHFVPVPDAAPVPGGLN